MVGAAGVSRTKGSGFRAVQGGGEEFNNTVGGQRSIPAVASLGQAAGILKIRGRAGREYREIFV